MWLGKYTEDISKNTHNPNPEPLEKILEEIHTYSEGTTIFTEVCSGDYSLRVPATITKERIDYPGNGTTLCYSLQIPLTNSILKLPDGSKVPANYYLIISKVDKMEDRKINPTGYVVDIVDKNGKDVYSFPRLPDISSTIKTVKSIIKLYIENPSGYLSKLPFILS